MIGAKVDMREIEKGLEAMADPKVVDRAARALKKPMRDDQRDHARQAEGSDGTWPARKRLVGRGKKVLRRNRRKLLGKLPRATIVYARGGVVTAMSRAKFSLAHQDGARVGRGAKLPKREFLWISDGLLTTAAAELQEAALRGWGGG